MAREPESQAGGEDPRLEASADRHAADDLRPLVARAAPSPGPWLIGSLAALMGLGAFLWMASHRPPATQDASQAVGRAPAAALTAPAPPPELAAMAAQGGPQPPVPAPAPVAPPIAGALPLSSPPPPAPPAPTTAETGRAPVLVVDFSPIQGATPTEGGGPAKTVAAARGQADPGLNADERFVARVEGGPEPARASATLLSNQSTLIPQGATIPAVLETALNSDLPGYARAVVSRDVRGFDGSTVLIPRGSRVIGEYRSAVAQGQTRAFVIWTRILRPDGVSIMIGSGGGDPLGRAGLAGKVDTHFLEEFSGAVLLTVLNAGATAVAGAPSTEVVIGSAGAGAASNLAGPLAAFAPVAIPPTIKVAQGTPVLIFVQRDLDFTRVEGGGK